MEWLEVKPFSSGTPPDTSPLLKILYSFGEPLIYVILSDGEKLRFFFKVPEDVRDQVKTFSQGIFGGEILSVGEPQVDFKFAAHMQMRSFFGFSIHDERESPESPIDAICHALQSRAGALEIIAIPSSYRKEMEGFLAKNSPDYTPLRAPYVAHGKGIVKALLGVKDDGKPTQRELSPSAQKKLQAVKDKAQDLHFLTQIMVYANDEADLRPIISTLPSHANQLIPHEVRRDHEPFNVVIPNFKLRNRLGRAWIYVPPIVFALFVLAGAFNLADLLRGLTPVDYAVLIISVLSAAPLAILVRPFNPIVLTLKELSVLVTLPKDLGQLDVERGKPQTRHGLLPTTRFTKPS